MVDHHSFKRPGGQLAPNTGRQVNLIKKPRISRDSTSNSAPYPTSARGFIPPSGPANGRPLGSGTALLGFQPPSRSNSNPGRPLSRGRNGSGNITQRPNSAQQYSSYSQPAQQYSHSQSQHENRIQVFDPDQDMGMYNQHYHQPQGYDQFSSQGHSQPAQPGDWDRPQSRQTLRAPAMDPVSHSPGAAGSGVPLQVHIANSAQALPPQRLPMQDFYSETRKRTADALKAEDGLTVKILGSSFGTDPLVVDEDEGRAKNQDPTQRPARSMYRPRDGTKVPELPVPNPEHDLQDKPETPEVRAAVEDQYDGRGTISDRNGKAPASTSSVPGPNAGMATQQQQRPMNSPPSKRLKVAEKKQFQQSLKSDDLLSAALKNNTMSATAFSAAHLGKLMMQDEEFSKMVGSVLKKMD
ncbi:hypothetical protein PG989_014383 [Apiospora arundinis]